MTNPVLKSGSHGEHVARLQKLLNAILAPVPPLAEDGDFGRNTESAVRAFQAREHLDPVDGVVGPDTWAALACAAAPCAPSTVFDHDLTGVLPRPGDPPRLSEADFQRAAEEFALPVAAIHAIAEVESGGRSGFDAERRPKILFEAHVFHRLTGGVHDASHPHLSQPAWNDACRQLYRRDQWGRMYEAMTLDVDAALASASWGMFQILGTNHAAAGWTDLRQFVADMFASELAHLRACLGFCATLDILGDLRPPQNWAHFACCYNGAGYRRNQYDIKLAAAYEKWSRRATPRPPTQPTRTRAAPR